MTWIVLTIILTICFWVGIAVWMWGRAALSDYQERKAAYTADPSGRYEPEPVFKFGLIGIGIAGVSLLIWVLLSVALTFHTVGQREVAIVYNFSGTISGKKDPGVVMTFPWQHVRKENVGILHDEWDFGVDNSAVSKDQQQIFANLAVNYQIDAANVVDLYERVGPAWKTIIIDARVPQVFKETTATYATPKITEEREQLRNETRKRLTEELSPYDIKVVDVFITNLGFSESYSAAIEEKQKQVQDALRAQAKVAQIEAEARQKVAEATGEAKANIARARGEATANRLRQRSLTPLLVQLEAIQRLNPNVEVIICPPNSVCIPNAGIIPNPNR
jgi:regulator of protease activity HflC (stomatin/prohibitin superfamily)